jgi:ABC-type molybdate transport system substrate-binding protein
MTSAIGSLVRAARMICLSGAVGILFGSNAMAGVIEVFHADSLAGPMSGLKKAFEAKHQSVTINLTPSTSRQLADRILKGETCDVFAPSSSAIANELVTKKAAA